MSRKNGTPTRKRKLRKIKLKLPFRLPKLKPIKLKIKWKVKRESFFLLAGVFLIMIAAYFPYRKENKALEELGYTKEEITAIRDQELLDLLLENEWYSKCLAKNIVEETLEMDYIWLYPHLADEAVLEDQDVLIINRLMDKGYEQDQIINLIPSLYEWELTPLLVFDYQYNEYMYIEDCINNRDVNSQDHFELSNDYYNYYSSILPVDEPDSLSKLVNKTYFLDSSYVPSSLVEVQGYYNVIGLQLAEEAAEALNTWGDAGRNVGITFYATSGYRDYDSQSSLYDIYVAQMGDALADSLSARAGFSEHQTGLTVDIAASNEDDKEEYKDTNAYIWTSLHSPDYGWILRYPEGKETITGYQFESWHYRYLGVELAQSVQNSKMTYDEFYCLYLKPWDHESYVPAERFLNETGYTVNTKVIETAEESETTEE